MQFGAATYEILYYGKRNFDTPEGLVSIYKEGINNEPITLLYGGSVTGFEVSVHIPAKNEITPVRYIMEPEFISQETTNEQRVKVQENEAKLAERWTTDISNGTVNFFLKDNHNFGWQLEVVDAALGTRYYQLNQTRDGGGNLDNQK